MQKCLPTLDWVPVDAEFKVSDVPHLIASLGGDQLYGNRSDVPLRELIQNGMDAVQAVRIMTQRDLDWGEVRIRPGSDANGQWIEVSDNGTGMSRHVLTGPLLDFGKSYWNTDNEPTGRLGKHRW